VKGGPGRPGLCIGKACPISHPLYNMKPINPVPSPNLRSGKVGWALLWLLGIPLPVLLIAFLIKGG